MIRKQSKQRRLILSYLKQSEGHMSAEQIFAGMKQAGYRISLATVYRNLDILTEMHEIRKIAHPVNGYVYDKTCEPHYHLHCSMCDELVDTSYPYMEQYNEALQNHSGWQVYSHSIVFEGICPSCAKSKHKHK